MKKRTPAPPLHVTPEEVERHVQPLADTFCRRLHNDAGDRVETMVTAKHVSTWSIQIGVPPTQLHRILGSDLLESGGGDNTIHDLRIAEHLHEKDLLKLVPWLPKNSDVPTTLRALTLEALAPMASPGLPYSSRRSRARAQRWFENGLPGVIGARRASGRLERTVVFRFGPAPNDRREVQLLASAAVDPAEIRRREKNPDKAPALVGYWSVIRIDGEDVSTAAVRYPAVTAHQQAVLDMWAPHLPFAELVPLLVWAEAPIEAKKVRLLQELDQAKKALVTAQDMSTLARMADLVARIARRPELAESAEEKAAA